MKYQGMIGVGCYGRPETLSRVLKKFVEKYIMGNFKGPDRQDSRPCVQFETIKLLKALIGGLLESHQFPESEIIENIKKSGITGFFLALERRRLNLSVFTRHGHFPGRAFTRDGQPVNSLNLANQSEIKRTLLH